MITQIYEASNRDEAKALVDVGVDFIGVVVGAKQNYPGVLNIDQAIKVLSGVTGQAKKVVLAFSQNLDEIGQIVKETKPDIVHIVAEPDIITPVDVQTIKIRYPEVKIMRTIPVVNEDSIEMAKRYEGIADYLLLDSRSKVNNSIGITGETHDWNISEKIVKSVSTPVILAGGLGPDNVSNAILKVKPFGVDSKTKTDIKGTNQKDMAKVREFIKNANSLN